MDLNYKKRRYGDVDSSFIIVEKSNKELFSIIINNQNKLLSTLQEIQNDNNIKFNKLNHKINQLQSNINNYEIVITNIMKEKIKDVINDLVFIIQETQQELNINSNYNQEMQEIQHQHNYIV